MVGVGAGMGTSHRYAGINQSSSSSSRRRLAKGAVIGPPEQLGQKASEGVGGQLSDQLSALGDRDVAGLFGDDQDDGVRLLAHAHSRAMPRAQFLLQLTGLGQWELHTGIADAPARNHNAQ